MVLKRLGDIMKVKVVTNELHLLYSNKVANVSVHCVSMHVHIHNYILRDKLNSKIYKSQKFTKIYDHMLKGSHP